MVTDEKRKMFYSKVSRVSLHQNELGILASVLDDEIQREELSLEGMNVLSPNRLNALKRLSKKINRNLDVNVVSLEDYRNYVPFVKTT
ncbi:MAG: hypothetical protein ACFFDP_03870 [Promethearchaeota archaeon]